MKKTLLTDIAESLNVSPTLVSFVINGKADKAGISDKTQKRVMEKIKELQYKPNHIAQSLRTGKTKTIGLIVSDFSNPFYSKIAGGIEKIASKNDYNLFVCSTDENPEKEVELIRMFQDRNVDGLIISTTQKNNTEILKLKKENYPFVLIDRYLKIDGINSVIVDNFNAAYSATEHLINLGLKNISFLSISPSYISTIRDRINGYKEALKKNKISLTKNSLIEIDFNNIQKETDKAVKKIINSENKRKAIFTSNNSIAIACLKSFAKFNINFPKDIALLSFDDIDFFKINNPGITAVAQPVEIIGEKAIEILLEEILYKGKSLKREIILHTILKIRKSCGEK